MAAVHLPATPAAKAAAPTAARTNRAHTANLRIVMETPVPVLYRWRSNPSLTFGVPIGAPNVSEGLCLARGFGGAENLFFDLPVDVAAGKLGSHANRVLD